MIAIKFGTTSHSDSYALQTNDLPSFNYGENLDGARVADKAWFEPRTLRYQAGLLTADYTPSVVCII